MKRHSVQALASLVIVAALVLGISAPAFAENGIVVRKVDSLRFPTIDLTVMSTKPLTDSVHLRENGKSVNGVAARTLLNAGTQVGIVVVIDSSSTMDSTVGYNQARVALESVIAAKKSNQKIGLVVFGGTARTVVDLTSDTAALREGLSRVQPAGASALWDGLGTATRLLAAQPSLQPNIILISGSNDNNSASSSFAQVRSDIRQTGTALFSATLHRAYADTDPRIVKLSEESGARNVETDEANDLPNIASLAVQSISNQQLVTYDSTTAVADEPQPLDIEVFAGTATTAVHTRSETVSTGFALEVRPFETPPPRPNAVRELGGVPTRTALSLVALLGVGLLALVLASLFVKDRSELSDALHLYPRFAEMDVTRLSDDQILTKHSVKVQKPTPSRRFMDSLQIRLEQADIPLRPGEALTICTGVSIAVTLLSYMLWGPMAAGLAFLATLAAPPLFAAYIVRRRHKRFVAMLPDVFNLLAGSLRIGHSLAQALDAISHEIGDPWSIELQRVTTEARLGRSVDDALDAMALRMQSEDFTWAVIAIRIQRRVGGNLAELLSTIADTVVSRSRPRREVKSITAEARISAIVLSILPPLVALVISLINPTYLEPLTSNLMGQAVLAAAGLLMVIGYFAMRKLGNVEEAA